MVAAGLLFSLGIPGFLSYESSLTGLSGLAFAEDDKDVAAENNGEKKDGSVQAEEGEADPCPECPGCPDPA